jgi:uncharacterized protein YuzE
MADRLTFEYDRIGDILYITRVAPYRDQETEEIGEDILARINPETGELEGVEILFWSKRLASGEALDLPITGELRLTV